jgi:hypothetical protein
MLKKHCLRLDSTHVAKLTAISKLKGLTLSSGLRLAMAEFIKRESRS